MIDKILDHLYISGAGDVLSGDPLLKYEITHVLTVSAGAIPVNRRLPSIQYHFIFAMDLPNQDLLGGGQLAEGVGYINDAVGSGGNVLVHCEIGVSRSATVVAAYIMQKFKFTASKAVELIKKSRPIVCPNEGFFAQLQIYEHLHYNTDGLSLSQSRLYKKWAVSSGNSPKSGTDRSAVAFIKEFHAENCSEYQGSIFRCWKCRQVLFASEHLVQHKRCDGELCKFGYIVEPLNWMNVSEYEGKITCPKCAAKIGSYVWGGQQCHGEPGAKCTEYVTPWVHLQRGKVDEIKAHSPIEQLLEPRRDIPSVLIS